MAGTWPLQFWLNSSLFQRFIRLLRLCFRYIRQGGQRGLNLILRVLLLKKRALPNATSNDLHLSHPTDEENTWIWELTSKKWKEALTPSSYLEASAYLMTVPRANDGGMTQWVLVDKNLPPGQRPLLASCETFRMRSLVSDAEGNVSETITHGIASVYCDPKYRGRGYASRLIKELGEVLPTWQTDTMKCAASVLFSGIGKKFYSDLGWHPYPSYHVEFDPLELKSRNASPVLSEDLNQLCKDDEQMVRSSLTTPSNGKMRITTIPEVDHMLWHQSKEDFVCEKLFKKQPQIKGAITGQPGNRIWIIWARNFDKPPESSSSDNTLYILRLVIENEDALASLSHQHKDLPYDERQLDMQVEQLKAVLEAAQAEAAEWGLHNVKIWGPTDEVQQLIERTGIQHRREVREINGVCSLRWYGEGSGTEESLEWIGNEKYGWC